MLHVIDLQDVCVSLFAKNNSRIKLSYCGANEKKAILIKVQPQHLHRLPSEYVDWASHSQQNSWCKEDTIPVVHARYLHTWEYHHSKLPPLWPALWLLNEALVFPLRLLTTGQEGPPVSKIVRNVLPQLLVTIKYGNMSLKVHRNGETIFILISHTQGFLRKLLQRNSERCNDEEIKVKSFPQQKPHLPISKLNDSYNNFHSTWNVCVLEVTSLWKWLAPLRKDLGTSDFAVPWECCSVKKTLTSFATMSGVFVNSARL